MARKSKRKLPYIENKEKIITNLILSETLTLINKKIGFEATQIVYDYILDKFTIIRPNQETYDGSMDILKKYNDLSFADSVTIKVIKVMNDFNIHEIMSFDSYFDNKEGIVKIE